jgi:hypothetical protein
MAEESNTRQTRKRKRVLSTILAAGLVVLLAAALFGALVLRTRARASRVVFGTSVSGLAKTLILYANDDPHGRLPPGDQWCDLLVQYDYCSSLRQFVHRGAIEGESSVAINKNLAGKSLSGIPKDVVLLFETDFGKDGWFRKELLKNRACYQTIPCGQPYKRVYKNRWNQAGGPEILTTEHYKGQGCNVAFVDTSVRFVKKEDLGKLRWK